MFRPLPLVNNTALPHWIPFKDQEGERGREGEGGEREIKMDEEAEE